jgi:hypothetical protein
MMRKQRVSTFVDTIASVGGAEILADELDAAGVQVMALDRKARPSPRRWLSLLQFVRGKWIDILHTHKFGSNVWGALIGSPANVPVTVVHEYSWAGEEEGRRRLGEAARRRQRTRHDREQTVRRLELLYDALYASRTSGRNGRRRRLHRRFAGSPR